MSSLKDNYQSKVKAYQPSPPYV
ncbi:stage V sporulation protein AC, partial [Bacillus licheniformis]|nr:stage V sporulation protein AC [Bacillus licheniformis]